MKALRWIAVVAGSAAIALAPGAALAQRQAPTPDQRLDRLERQMDQLQRQVFPKGRPASTAGFVDDPAATQSSVAVLDQRLDAIEKQMAEMLRQNEENSHRLQALQSDLTTLRNSEDQKIQALEQRLSDAATAAAATPSVGEPAPAKGSASKPSASKTPQPKAVPAKAESGDSTETAAADAATDPGEDAYSQGFHFWEAGNYDQAIAALKAFVRDYPKHRRVSFANNLIGRALLDKGDPRAAAEALLANYRGDPSGERAPDSLYYLGQALMKLGQPAQACKAYGELDAVYGAKVRPDLKKLEDAGKVQAQCR